MPAFVKRKMGRMILYGRTVLALFMLVGGGVEGGGDYEAHTVTGLFLACNECRSQWSGLGGRGRVYMGFSLGDSKV